VPSVLPASVRLEVPGSPGHLLRLVRSGSARSRSDLVALTGVSRSTVSVRVEQLLRAELLAEQGTSGSTGGRPPRLLTFNSRCGAVLAVDLGVTRAAIAVSDLAGGLLAQRSTPLQIADGPEAVLGHVDALAQGLLAEAGLQPDDVCAIGIGLPGPVEFSRGRPVHPPVMPGWHDYDVPAAFARYGCPVLVDNDVNVMAAGELDAAPHEGGDFLVVKVGTGIGCGIVLDGEVYRGSAGSAGDIGHIHVPDARRVLCGCGNENCLEALAGGAALARDARERGLPVQQPRDLVELALNAEPEALLLVRDAGRHIGEVLAGLVNFFNPSRIVVTGGVARAGNPLIAGIREAVYRRSLPLAARSLDIRISSLSDAAGCRGAARMAIEAHLADERVEQLLEAAS
jgi:predicted NBD/HSP70 family sugar kinase